MCPRSNAEPCQASDAEVERWGLLLVGATHFARLCLADGSLLQSAMDERNPAGALPNSQDQEGRGPTFSSAERSSYRGSAALVILAASLPIMASGGTFYVDAPSHLFRMALGEAMLTGKWILSFIWRAVLRKPRGN